MAGDSDVSDTDSEEEDPEDDTIGSRDLHVLDDRDESAKFQSLAPSKEQISRLLYASDDPTIKRSKLRRHSVEAGNIIQKRKFSKFNDHNITYALQRQKSKFGLAIEKASNNKVGPSTEEEDKPEELKSKSLIAGKAREKKNKRTESMKAREVVSQQRKLNVRCVCVYISHDFVVL